MRDSENCLCIFWEQQLQTIAVLFGYPSWLNSSSNSHQPFGLLVDVDVVPQMSQIYRVRFCFGTCFSIGIDGILLLEHPLTSYGLALIGRNLTRDSVGAGHNFGSYGRLSSISIIAFRVN